MGPGGAAVQPVVTKRRRAAVGLVLGPVVFIAGWAITGALTPGYSPTDDAISRLAAVGAPHRALMTAAFVAYGVAVLVGSTALRASPLRQCWWFAATNGVATLAVAALPLDRSATVDRWHGVAAAVGYASITALPLASAGPLRRGGRRRAAALAVAAGVTSGLCLVATTATEANGLFQRVGLTVGDAWLIATGVALASVPRRADER